jgi:hypothetical protein
MFTSRGTRAFIVNRNSSSVRVHETLKVFVSVCVGRVRVCVCESVLVRTVVPKVRGFKCSHSGSYSGHRHQRAIEGGAAGEVLLARKVQRSEHACGFQGHCRRRPAQLRKHRPRVQTVPFNHYARHVGVHVLQRSRRNGIRKTCGYVTVSHCTPVFPTPIHIYDIIVLLLPTLS